MEAQSESGNGVERYLLRFRQALKSLSKTEREEIVSDIRSHIQERLIESDGAALKQTLDALGSPESLAQTYRNVGLLQKAAATSSPWTILRATFVWSLAGVRGFLALLALFAGYGIALSLVACGLLKPVFPERVGMWIEPPFFTFGILPLSAHASHELLGYWIIPIALATGVAAFIGTTKFARWLIRRYATNDERSHNGHLTSALALLFVLAVVLRAQSPSLVGKWSGVLDAGAMKLHVGLNIAADAPGAPMHATMSVLEQGATLPVDAITRSGDHVSFRIAGIGGSYDGTLKGGRIEGTWSQAGHDLPLIFAQGDGSAEVLRRPQNPTPPFPYNTQEVSVANGAVTLAGTMTSPKSGGPPPAVLLVTGSGPEDRDETVFQHKPFLILADTLTRAGFVVLRLDDRGTAKSTGDYKTAGFEEFTSDALAAVDWLKARPEVDAKKIGILGHSEGGAVGPLAALRSEDVAFLVLMAAPGVPFDQLMYRQEADLMRAEGAPDSTIAANRAAMEQVFLILRQERDDAKASERLKQLVAETKKKAPAIGASLEAQAPGMLLPEFRSLASYTPAAILGKVRCPVLAIGGSKDLQVAADENLPAIAVALGKGRNPDYAVEELPGLNHLFQTANTGSPAEYAMSEETMSPRALAVVREWLLAHTR